MSISPNIWRMVITHHFMVITHHLMCFFIIHKHIF